MTDSVKATLDALINAFFQAVSFEAGNKPAYSTLYDLFIERANIIRNSGPVPEIETVAEFITPRQAAVDSGALTQFREAELKDITEIFGNVAHRLSTYEKDGVRDGTAFSGRGVIFTQFILTQSGWKISAMAWDDERDGLVIPERYR